MAMVVAAHASGAYAVRPAQPPASIVESSRRYELGKAIFNGSIALKPAAAIPRQEQRLRQLQQRLPAARRNSVDLASLAGRLTPEQLAALEHFLSIRYKIK